MGEESIRLIDVWHATIAYGKETVFRHLLIALVTFLLAAVALVFAGPWLFHAPQSAGLKMLRFLGCMAIVLLPLYSLIRWAKSLKREDFGPTEEEWKERVLCSKKAQEILEVGLWTKGTPIREYFHLKDALIGLWMRRSPQGTFTFDDLVTASDTLLSSPRHEELQSDLLSCVEQVSGRLFQFTDAFVEQYILRAAREHHPDEPF